MDDWMETHGLDWIDGQDTRQRDTQTRQTHKWMDGLNGRHTQSKTKSSTNLSLTSLSLFYSYCYLENACNFLSFSLVFSLSMISVILPPQDVDVIRQEIPDLD